MLDPATHGELIDTTVRVATWNLWWQFGPWEQRLPRIIDVLRDVDADVIALQEVWGTEETDAAAEIASALGHTSVYEAAIELSAGVRFGNAVVSRWPITAHDHRRLPPRDQPDEGRTVLRADVDGPRGPLQVYCTHLNWRFDHSAVRQAQVTEAARFVAEGSPRTFPPILCGDLNSVPTSAEVQMLTGQRPPAVDGLVFIDAWPAANPDEVGWTWDNANPFVASQLEPNRRLDYVLVGWPKSRGAGHVRAARMFGTTPIDGIFPSDHFGVVADLRY